ncbi:MULTISPECIES: hypothetical protein [unclassified Mesorhizobium]|uniref:hypothetical protein n=1 Tax=unclassified Mesorhizobium TaxID=325217 RepID=UPI0003CDFA0C|nr:MULTISPECIES: hypothetical protein [unclassified Mesorhizobium]ESY10602.1 hypothetical protein X751_31095 [Mesorhizobium sp. LNJC395A00]WJI75702.1 hypothetical protein NLY37_02955 [Mesorhizobium sp. C395A]
MKDLHRLGVDFGITIESFGNHRCDELHDSEDEKNGSSSGSSTFERSTTTGNGRPNSNCFPESDADFSGVFLDLREKKPNIENTLLVAKLARTGYFRRDNISCPQGLKAL